MTWQTYVVCAACILVLLGTGLHVVSCILAERRERQRYRRRHGGQL